MQRTIVILTSEEPSKPGGAEHVVRELAKGLESRGYGVVVLHRANAAPHWLQQPKSYLARELGNLLISWYVGRALRRLHNREIAAVISNGPVGWYIPKLTGNVPKKVHIYHGTYRAQAEAIRPFINQPGYLKLKWWDSMVLEKACGAGKVVICNSDQTREEVRRFFGYRGTTTWCPLDTSHFRPLDKNACRSALKLPCAGIVGLFAGSAHPMKGLPIIQTLIRALPDVQWILAIRGNIPEDITHQSRVKIFADAPYDLLPTLYGAADFAVFPSRYEPFGLVVAESLACGTPTIASPGGAMCFLEGPTL
jgi:glycosyltransferase involved in cell wall biosynthesis